MVLAHNATACERASQHDVMGITENEENELRAAGRGVPPPWRTTLATIIYLFYLALGGVDRDLALGDSLGAAAKARWSVTVW